jgi:hypothetical protein
MEDITKFLELLLKAPFASILLLAGLFFVITGFIGGIPKIKDYKEQHCETIIISGFACLVFGLLLASLIWLLEKDNAKYMEILMNRYDGLFIEIIVAIIIVVLFALASINIRNKIKELEKRENLLIENVQKREDLLVKNVEDATRRTLNGFQEIFPRALKLIREAKNEIFMISFVLNFGEPHLLTDISNDQLQSKSKIQEEYERTNNNKSFYNDVQQFKTSLKQKLLEPKIKIEILIADNTSIESVFLESLKNRPDYSVLKNDFAYQYKKNQILGMRSECIDSMKSKQNLSLYEAKTIPIQLIIADLPTREGSHDQRYGCLVFMVGTELLPNIQSGEEFGFYTELTSAIDVYKNLALTLIRNGTKIN